MMTRLPPAILSLFWELSPLFSAPTFANLITLFVGSILTTGKRRISSILQTMGLANDAKYSKYYNVFSKAKWSALACGAYLLNQLNSIIPFNEPLVVLFDETIETRSGPKITGLGLYRKSINPKQLHYGLKWLVATVLTPVSWSTRLYALPFLSTLTRRIEPLERSVNEADHKRIKRYKPFTEHTRQVMTWLKKQIGNNRKIIVVADGAFCAYRVLSHAQSLGIAFISRMRWDAALYEEPPALTGKRGRPRIKGAKLPTPEELRDDDSQPWIPITLTWYGGAKVQGKYLTGTAIWYNPRHAPIRLRWIVLRTEDDQFPPSILCCTDSTIEVKDVIKWFVGRWNIEVTFYEVNQHLGFGAQNNWSDLAVERLTPAILGQHTMVCLAVEALLKEKSIQLPKRETAWYQKKEATFSDALAFLRQELAHIRFFEHQTGSPISKKTYSHYEVLEMIETFLDTG